VSESAHQARLSCARIALTDFRNHAAFDLALSAAPVCLFGANGAGKTNILEALTMFAPGRGLRSAGLAELARHAPDLSTRPRLWSVSVKLIKDGEDVQAGVAAERQPDGGVKRLARVDGRTVSAAELSETAPMVWLTPAMDRLFSGPAGDRRRFLDRLVLARGSSHGQVAAAYERALRERQRLLNEERFDDHWLNALEREMAGHGAALAAARVETLDDLAAAIEARPDSIFPKARVRLEGSLEAAFTAGAVSADIEERFLAQLKSSRRRDAVAGRALDGPHRTDLIVHHAAKNMPAELSSTGEQKALLLGLVLAHAQGLARDAGVGPCLLLLDEAGAHLDPERRAALFDELLALPGQTWLTGTEAALFEAFGDRAQHVRVG
jgi:DNA replication and repair protein RecF